MESVVWVVASCDDVGDGDDDEDDDDDDDNNKLDCGNGFVDPVPFPFETPRRCSMGTSAVLLSVGEDVDGTIFGSC